MKNKKNWVIFILIALTSYFLGGINQSKYDQQIKNQGYTLQEWPDVYIHMSSTLHKEVQTCQEDPSSSACNPPMFGSAINPLGSSTESCSHLLTPKSNAADIVWHFRHCSAPAPASSSNYLQSQNISSNTETYWSCSGMLENNGRNVESTCFPQTVTIPQNSNIPGQSTQGAKNFAGGVPGTP